MRQCSACLSRGKGACIAAAANAGAAAVILDSSKAGFSGRAVCTTDKHG